MKQIKRKGIIIGIGLFILICSWGLMYYQHSTIEKVIQQQEENAYILQIIPISSEQKMVIFEFDEMIQAKSLSKGFFGWKTTASGAPAVTNRNEETPFRISNFSILSVDGHGFLYGYVNPNNISQIRFQTDSFDIKHVVSTYYWYIPLHDEDAIHFRPDQFSVIKRDGTEIFYPFDRAVR